MSIIIYIDYLCFLFKELKNKLIMLYVKMVLGGRQVNCSNCGNLNEGGKFCVHCGNQLGNGEVSAQQATANTNSIPVNSQPAQPNRHVETAKAMSKLYFSYFIQGIKTPTKAAQNVGGEQFINGLITMIIYAISIPLMFYFATQNDYIDLEFTEVVIKPAFYYLIFIGFTVLVTFAVIKLGRVQATVKDVFARFGAFLIVPTAFLIAALILSLIQVEFFAILLAFGFLGLFIVVPFTIFSYKKDVPYGLDGVYGTFLTYLAIIILLATIVNMVIDQLMDVFGFGLF